MEAFVGTYELGHVFVFFPVHVVLTDFGGC